MTAQYWEGYRKFAAGERWQACTTSEQIRGWLAASAGKAACDIMDAMAKAGASPEELDRAVESSVEDDYEWIRTGC